MGKKQIKLSPCSVIAYDKCSEYRRPTHERPSANDWMAEASSIANLRNENERLNAADCLAVGEGKRARVRVVNIRILSRC